MTGLGIFNSIGNIVSNGVSLVEKATQVSNAAIFNPVGTAINLTSALGAKLGIFNQQSVTPSTIQTGPQTLGIAIPINSSGLGIMTNVKNVSAVGSLAGQAVQMNSNGSISGTSQQAKAIAKSDYVNGAQMSSTTDDSNTSGVMQTALYVGGALLAAKLLGIKIPFLK